MKNAILINCAECIGSGSDQFKRVNGLTRCLISKAVEIDPNAILLAPSNTNYNGWRYKQIILPYKNHRQIDPSSYTIIGRIG